MSQIFDGSWDKDSDVQTTMQTLIESSLDALRTKFSGAFEPTTTEAFQWWADVTTSILKLRNATNTGWISIYNFSTQTVLIADNQITTAKILNLAVTNAKIDTDAVTAAKIQAQAIEATKINDTARKPSLITGEDILPTSCSLRGGQVALGSMPWQIPQAAGAGNIGARLAWAILYNFKVYCHAPAQTFVMVCYNTTCKTRFIINDGTPHTSSESAITSGWSTESSLSLSVSSPQWLDVVIEGYSEIADPGPYGSVHGWSMYVEQ